MIEYCRELFAPRLKGIFLDVSTSMLAVSADLWTDSVTICLQPGELNRKAWTNTNSLE